MIRGNITKIEQIHHIQMWQTNKGYHTGGCSIYDKNGQSESSYREISDREWSTKLLTYTSKMSTSCTTEELKQFRGD